MEQLDVRQTMPLTVRPGIRQEFHRQTDKQRVTYIMPVFRWARGSLAVGGGIGV